ncbi:glycerol-3-phosphate dehydrogenase, partial [Goodea atripinnis]
GSAIAKIVGANAAKYDTFDTKVNMWVFEEMVNGLEMALREATGSDVFSVSYKLFLSSSQNIVAVGAGFCDGLGFGDNTKAAVIRLGLMEMIAFAKVFCTDCPVSPVTFLESCGVADLITTCYGGRNRKIGEAFAKTGKSIEQLEIELLNGQKLQGPATASEVHVILKQKNMVEKFPLFTAVHQICFNGHPVTEFIKCLQNHPEHM